MCFVFVVALQCSVKPLGSFGVSAAVQANKSSIHSVCQKKGLSSARLFRQKLLEIGAENRQESTKNKVRCWSIGELKQQSVKSERILKTKKRNQPDST